METEEPPNQPTTSWEKHKLLLLKPWVFGSGLLWDKKGLKLNLPSQQCLHCAVKWDGTEWMCRVCIWWEAGICVLSLIPPCSVSGYHWWIHKWSVHLNSCNLFRMCLENVLNSLVSHEFAKFADESLQKLQRKVYWSSLNRALDYSYTSISPSSSFLDSVELYAYHLDQKCYVNTWRNAILIFWQNSLWVTNVTEGNVEHVKWEDSIIYEILDSEINGTPKPGLMLYNMTCVEKKSHQENF